MESKPAAEATGFKVIIGVLQAAIFYPDVAMRKFAEMPD